MTERDPARRDEHSWRVTAPDILDLPTPSRAQALRGWRTFLEQLDHPLRILISARHELEGVAPGARPLPGTPPALGAAVAAEQLRALDQRACRRRTVHLVAGERTLQSLAQYLAGAQVVAEDPPPLALGPLREGARELQVGGRHLASLRLGHLPGVPVEAGWLWSLTGLPADFDLLIEVRPSSGTALDRSLRRRQRGLRARQLAAAERGEGDDPRLATELAAAGGLREVLAGGSGGLYELRLTLTLAADSREELAALRQMAKRRVAAVRGRLLESWCDQLPAWAETSLPAARLRARAAVLSTGELTSLWPWLDDWRGPVPDGVCLGRHLRTGAPVQLALRQQLPNANLGVVAASGSGKSYLGGLLGLEALRLGIRTVVLDPENEHRRWCAKVGGAYLAAGEGLDPGFNLLQMVEPGTAPGAAAELASLLCGPLTARQRGAVAGAVRATLAEAGPQPILISDCLSHMREEVGGEELASRLLPWLEGSPGRLFNRLGVGPEVRSVTVVGLRELPSTWLPAATLLLSHWLWSWVRSQPGDKQAIVDEAGLLADNPALQRLLAHLARRIRKYQGSLVLLTQAAGDLLGAGVGEVLAVNSATLMLGNQRAGAARRLQQAFSLDEEQRLFLEAAGRGQFLLLAAGRSIPVQVEAPALHQDWLSQPREVDTAAPA
ncbi:MAG: VirB4 family type IV secretion system protein [Candidatus Dormibacteria bacterium]